MDLGVTENIHRTQWIFGVTDSFTEKGVTLDEIKLVKNNTAQITSVEMESVMTTNGFIETKLQHFFLC